MRKTINAMKNEINNLKRGRYSIGECEYALNQIISNDAAEIKNEDDRWRFIRVLKRRSWRMLLNATGRDAQQ